LVLCSRERHEDVELFTPRNRGAHAASRSTPHPRGGLPVTHEYPRNPTVDSVSIRRVMSLRNCGFTLVSLTFASWNRIAGWLRCLKDLRGAA